MIIINKEEENKKEKGRIRDFLKENLISFYSSLLPSSLSPSIIQIDENGRKIYSEEERLFDLFFSKSKRNSNHSLPL